MNFADLNNFDNVRFRLPIWFSSSELLWISFPEQNTCFWWFLLGSTISPLFHVSRLLFKLKFRRQSQISIQDSIINEDMVRRANSDLTKLKRGGTFYVSSIRRNYYELCKLWNFFQMIYSKCFSVVDSESLNIKTMNIAANTRA